MPVSGCIAGAREWYTLGRPGRMPRDIGKGGDMKKRLLLGLAILGLLLSTMGALAAKSTTTCKTKAKVKCATTAKRGAKGKQAKAQCTSAAKTRSAAKCGTKPKKVAKKAKAAAPKAK